MDPSLQYSEARQKRFEEEDSQAKKCSTCGGTFWLGPIPVNRLKADDSLVIGQTIPKLGALDFPIYLCIGCLKRAGLGLLVPTVDGSEVGRRAQLYNRLCDLIEDTKTELEPTFTGLHTHLENQQMLEDEQKANQ